MLKKANIQWSGKQLFKKGNEWECVFRLYRSAWLCVGRKPQEPSDPFYD